MDEASRPTPPGLVGQVGMNVVGDVGEGLYRSGYDMAKSDNALTQAIGNLLKTGGKVGILAGDDLVARFVGNTVSGIGKSLADTGLLAPVGKLVLALGHDQD